MYGPPVGRLLFDLALEQAGVFRQDADADVGGQEAEVEGAALAAHFEVALAEDEAGPDEAAVGGDLFGPEEELAEALRRPLGRPFAAGCGGRQLPQRDADGEDQRHGQHQPGPFTVGAVGGGVCHAGVQGLRPGAGFL